MTGWQSLIPVVMAGIIAVYSLVIAVLLADAIDPGKSYSLFKLVSRIGSTRRTVMLTFCFQCLSTSWSGPFSRSDRTRGWLRNRNRWRRGILISEFVFGMRTDSKQGVRAYMQQSRVFVGMVLILIFAEVLGLYGYA